MEGDIFLWLMYLTNKDVFKEAFQTRVEQIYGVN